MARSASSKSSCVNAAGIDRMEHAGHSVLIGDLSRTIDEPAPSIARERHAPLRTRVRRDPRVKYFGFTAAQWPFLFVLVGNWVFALAFFLGAKLVWHWAPEQWSTPGDKLALVFECAAF